ncbi:MarR family winged helix-turn-helix transcriptional regulator [Planctomicrobium sp. SH664]|uniref:MarR family winged helix-turn-helix transcriptional regulator n=1 Tax=Planctomicrobium sp. SH664 TaxID=3448125 RepID=UPI003F5C500D
MVPNQKSTDTAWLQKWNRLSRRLRQELSARYAQAGLNESRAAVLEVLSGAPEAWTQTELANDLCLSESNLCALIERMRREGLLCRERSTIDRRKTLLTATDLGRSSCASIAEIKAELGLDLSAHLTPQFFQQFNQVLDSMLSAVDALNLNLQTQRRSA